MQVYLADLIDGYIDSYAHGCYYYVRLNKPYDITNEILKAIVKRCNRQVKFVVKKPSFTTQQLAEYIRLNYNSVRYNVNPTTYTLTLYTTKKTKKDCLKIYNETGYYTKIKPPLLAATSLHLNELYIHNFQKTYALRQKMVLTEVNQLAKYFLFTCLGGAKEIGRSCYLFRTNNSKILVDIGLGFKSQEQYPHLNMPEIGDVNSIDAVIVTHPHLDHMGSLVYLVNSGYKNPIYMTGAAQKFTCISLIDCFKLFNLKERPTYTVAELKTVMLQVIPLEYNKKYFITKDIGIRLLPSCHILGGAMTEFNVNNHVFLWTSDFCIPSPGVELLKPFDFEKRMYSRVLSEGTNLAKERGEGELFYVLKEYITEAKQNLALLLMPTLLIGRAQELLYRLITCMQREPALRYPIYVDLSIVEIIQVYREHITQLSNEGKTFIQSTLIEQYITVLDKTNKHVPYEQPGIVLAPSGMLEGGSILNWIVKAIEDPKVICILSCYQASGTLGAHLLNSVPGTIMQFTNRGVTHKLKLNFKVRSISSYIGAHITKTPLLAFLTRHSRESPIIVHTAPNVATLKLLDSKGYLVPSNLETLRLL